MRAAVVVAAVGALGCSRTEPPAPAAPLAWTTIEGSKGAVAAIARTAAEVPGQPVLFVGATWCGSCAAYKASLDDPTMRAAHAPVHIIEVDAERHVRVIEAIGAQPAGVPHWERLARTGQSAGTHIDGRAWSLPTVTSMAPALSAFFAGG